MGKYAALLFCLLLLAIFWIFWVPGIRVASDYHASWSANLVSNISPLTWKEINAADGLGEYIITTLWSQPIHIFFGFLSVMNLTFEIETKIFGLIILLTAFFSIKKLLNFMAVGFWGEITGTLFYLTNSFFVLLFDGGQLSLSLAYGILPLPVLYFLKLSEQNNMRNKVLLTSWLIVLSFIDVRVLYLLGVIFFLYFFLKLVISYKEITRLIKIYIPVFIIAAAFAASVHSYWLLPAFLAKSPALPAGYGRETQIDTLSFSSIAHSLFLQQPHWYKNIFGRVSPPNVEFILIPFLVFLPIFLKRKDFLVAFWLVVALVGVFLSKGSQEPLSEVYPWLFNNVPGFSIFRDPVKFFFLSALSYSVLIGISIGQNVSLAKKTLPILVVLYLVWLVRPVFLGQMTGLLSNPPFVNEFNKLNQQLKDDGTFSRIFWIPNKAPLGFFNSIHPPVDAALALQKRPFASGVKGTYETFNFLREAPFMGEIFDVAGIGYIVYPFLDERRDNLHPDNLKYYYTFFDQLSNRPWLSKINDSSIPILKVKEHQDRFFVTSNVWFVLGSDDIYKEATTSTKLKLSKNALIFVEEFPELGRKMDEFPEAKIILNRKSTLDLAASFIPLSNLIFPAKNLNFDPGVTSGWWKRETSDLIRWRDFLQTKYALDNQDFDLGGGWAVGEGSVKLKIKSEKLKNNKILLARVLESTRSGSLSFAQDGNLIGRVDTKKPGNNIRWFEVGEIKSEGELEIKSSGDINVVNALAVLEKNEWVNYQGKLAKLQGRIVDFDENNAKNSNSPTVTYKQVNPTKYVVNINNLTQTAFLVFSQNYDNLWRMNHQTPLPVYSLLNGFRIEQNGEYLVEFEAQKYVYPGLVISGLTLAVAFVIIKSQYA